ncbi:MAG: DUF4279 domain-containing protein [Treponema sp.]|nr:DUF4279 domain-containing protein [Treponema sp.]
MVNEENINELKVIADNEIINPQWAITKQFLEINNIEILNNEYEIERHSIFNDFLNKSKKYIYEISFFYKIKDERYFYCIVVDINKKEVSRVGPYSACDCHLHVYSEDINLNDMKKLTKLKHSDSGAIGEKTKNGKGINSINWLIYKFTNLMSYELEEALNMFLDELEKDEIGIKNLAKKTDAFIDIVKYQYINANAGIEINTKLIKRLNKLNLGFCVDLYICGERNK